KSKPCEAFARTASTVSILTWTLQSRDSSVKSDAAPLTRSGLAAQPVLLLHGLDLIGRLALEHRAGGEIAAHLAALHVEPIDDLGLGELDDLPKLHLLGRAWRIVDASSVFVAARRELRQPEVFVAVTV